MATTYPVSTIAKLFNLTERRVQQLASQGIIPKAEKGKYDLITSTRAYIKYLQERATGKDIEPQDTHIERARLVKAQADKTELEVKTMTGEFIAAIDAEVFWSGLVATFRTRMLVLPSRCAKAILQLKSFNEIEQLLKEHVHEALSELSRYDPEHMQANQESSKAGSTATRVKNKPVGRQLPLLKQ